MDVRDKAMFDKLREAEREWMKERKRLREEVRSLRKIVEEREEANTTTTTTEDREYWKWLVEEMCVERAMKDEAVERWKQLYLDIKNELDHLILIHTTSSSGEAIMQRKLKEEEETKIVKQLRDEVRDKEKTINETLKEKIDLMDRQKYEKEREIDLLRQSLRILGSKNKNKRASFASMNMLILKTKCV
ncbi:unnamed protein product [Cochlearia groenlandica]